MKVKSMPLGRPTALGILAVLSLGSVSATCVPVGPATAQTTVEAPLTVDDIDWLFPPPSDANDLSKGIAVNDLISTVDGQPVWSSSAFAQFLALSTGPAGKVTVGGGGSTVGIDLPDSVRNVDVWRVAGVRIDAGAPGLSPATIAEFGQSPQIRLILHPVTVNPDGSVNVHDIAAHLIFSFELQPPVPQDPTKPDCLPKIRPDRDALRSIFAGAVALRDKLNSGALGGQKVTTAGMPLGVHPGLANPATESSVRDEMKTFLSTHLSSAHLSAMSVTGLGDDAKGAPWVFLSMLFDPDSKQFKAVIGPTLQVPQFAELLNPRRSQPRVVPMPVTNNVSPTTCESAALGAPTVPPEGRIGMSTANFFADPRATPQKAMLVADKVRDASSSHFFNTDCVSCHTETSVAMRALGTASFDGIDSAVLPPGDWDVRNFGWGPGKSGKPQATATRRTAAEAEAVVDYVNGSVLNK